ncbi:MAG: gluconate 2-dehydrogenase subunit 3 family protein [Cytophagaceae bacterium]|nr:gluconate 2-dehydrogenase subunit 3 family protein [Cytophagaceae bacterium]
MNRRDAIQMVAVMMGGLVSAPTLAALTEGPSRLAGAPGLTFTAEQESLLAEICETIIPTTDTPGAKDAQVEKFIMTLVSDCYPKEYQDRFMAGMSRVDRESKALHGKPFAQIQPEQRVSILKMEEANAYADRKEGMKETPFFMMAKELTLFGFFTSEPGATKVLEYQWVPGKFEGCIPLKPGQRAWAT